MKKLYSLLLAFVAASFSFTANALYSDMTVTVNIDDVSRVSVSVKNFHFVDGEQTEFKNGENKIKFLKADYGEYDNPTITFGVKDAAYGIVGTYAYTYGETTYENPLSGSMTSITVYPNDAYTYTITSFVIADERSEKCTVWVDDASVVNCTRADYTTISLTSNQETEVAFAPSTNTRVKDLPLKVRAGKTLYKVTLDGEAVAESNGYYYITPKNGSNVRIEANFPDVNVPVSFTGTTEAINKVTVDGVEVPVATAFAEGWTVKLGSTVQFWGNLNDYSFASLTVNGATVNVGQSSQWSYGYGYSFTVTTETTQTIVVGAKKFETVQFTIDVDDPANVVVRKGSNYDETDIVLTKGVNTIDIVLGKTPNIFVKLAGGATLVSFVDNNDVDYSSYVPDGVNVYSPKAIAVAAGQAFTIRTKGLERDRKCAIYIEGNLALVNGGSVDRAADGSMRSRVVTLGASGKDGYTVVEFAESEAMFSFAFNGVNGVVYINDTVYAASTMSFYQKLNDGDVVKAYFGAAPQTYEITLAEDYDAYAREDEDYATAIETLIDEEGNGLVMAKDIITEVPMETWWNMFSSPAEEGTPMKVLQGTQIDLNLGGAADALAVKYNEQVVTPVDGVCTLTITTSGAIQFISRSGATALQQVAEGAKATKVVRDGRVLIIRGEEVFDVLGNAVVR